MLVSKLPEHKQTNLQLISTATRSPLVSLVDRYYKRN